MVLLLIIYNQLRIRKIKKRRVWSYLAIMLVGINIFYKGISSKQLLLDKSSIEILIFVFLVLAIGSGIARACTYKIWQTHNIVYRKGTLITLLIWAITIIAHLFFDSLIENVQTSSLLYLGITLLTQHIVTLQRVKM